MFIKKDVLFKYACIITKIDTVNVLSIYLDSYITFYFVVFFKYQDTIFFIFWDIVIGYIVIDFLIPS